MVESTPTSSFIPKTTLPKPTYQSGGMGFLITVSLIILIASAAVTGGMFFYKNLLTGDIEALNSDLSNMQKEFEAVSIRNFSQTSDAINNAKEVIGSHKAVSNIFTFLEDNTLPDVRFSNFIYGSTDEETISMNGEAPSFTELAKQAFVLEQSSFTKELSLSNLSLKKDGRVGFAINVKLDPNLLTYKPE